MGIVHFPSMEVRAIDLPKLIRDRMPHIIESEGRAVKTHIVEGGSQELLDLLHAKLQEEMGELKSKEWAIDELVDIFEVLLAFAAFYGVSHAQLEFMRQEKARQRGTFSGRIVLDAIL